MKTENTSRSKDSMKRKLERLILTVAVAAVMIIPVKQTLGYFSDHEKALGEKKIVLNGESEVQEEVSEGNKHIEIANTGESNLIVRVAVYYSGDYVEYEYEEKDWKQIGDWWYYTKVLGPGEKTSELFVRVVKEKVPSYDFDIVVVHESQRVRYEGDKLVTEGKDWSYKGY